MPANRPLHRSSHVRPKRTAVTCFRPYSPGLSKVSPVSARSQSIVFTRVNLDEESVRFQAEVDAVVRKWAGDDEREYWRRWKQLGSWSINRTQGDAVKKARLKKRLMELSGGRCADCDRPSPAAALQMHRLDQALAHDPACNFGYFEENVVLLCADCHDRREATRR
jgi:hypothetical protein